MTTSANFQLLPELEALIHGLNEIIRSEEIKDVDVMGVLKPTFSKWMAQYLVNHGIQPDIATGIAEVGEGGVFAVPGTALPEPDPGTYVACFRVLDGQAHELGRVSSDEFVKHVEAQAVTALMATGAPGRPRGAFLWEGAPKYDPLIVGAGGRGALAFDSGFPVMPVRKGFQWGDRPDFFSLLTASGRRILSVDQYGQQVVPWRRGFHWGAEEYGEYLFMDRRNRIYQSWGRDGKPVIGGGGGADIDFDALPISDQHIDPGEPWNDNGVVGVKRHYDPLYSLSVRPVWPNHQAVYGYLDGLMAEFPDYILRDVLGLDPWGNEVRRYRFRPADYTGLGNSYPQEQVDYPKIVLLGAVHGNEGHSVKANIHFLEEVCRRWKSDPRLADIRWGCEIVLIPIVSPTSYDANSRTNQNGVNINRNFPTGWAAGGSGNPSSSDYRGPEPESELETRYVIDVMQSVGVTAVVDHHRMTTMSDNSRREAIWMGVRDERPVGVAMSMINHAVGYVRRQFDFVWQDNIPLGRLAMSSDGTVARHGQALGVDSYLLETPNNIISTGTFNVYLYAVETVRHLVWLIYNTERLARASGYVID